MLEMKKIKDYSLYFITSEEFSKGKSTLEVARAAIAGGIDVLQMREKGKKLTELTMLGKELLQICREKGVTFVVNDDPVLAKELDTDGVHLGQSDLEIYPVEKTRQILGDKIIGVSAHSILQFKEANRKDFDYIAYGPIFETKAKDFSIGAEDIDEVMNIAEKPVIFIGGINLANIDTILERGARNIAVIKAITEADDIATRTRELKAKVQAKKGKISSTPG